MWPEGGPTEVHCLNLFMLEYDFAIMLNYLSKTNKSSLDYT